LSETRKRKSQRRRGLVPERAEAGSQREWRGEGSKDAGLAAGRRAIVTGRTGELAAAERAVTQGRS
jgi:hypothetical protein